MRRKRVQKIVDKILNRGLRTELNRKRSSNGRAAARGKLLHPVSSATMSPRDAANTRVAVKPDKVSSIRSVTEGSLKAKVPCESILLSF